MNGHSGFRMNPLLAGLMGAYPASEDVLQAVGLGLRERSVVARLRVSEGIPFAFRDCPALYEEARTWLAKGLELNSKESAWEAAGGLATLWRPNDGVWPIGGAPLIWTSSPYRNDCSRGSGGISCAGATIMTMARSCQHRSERVGIGRQTGKRHRVA